MPESIDHPDPCALPNGRLRCVVPFCRRTFKRQPDEPRDVTIIVICGKHWRLGDAKLRALRTRALRKKRRRLASMLFDRVMKQAIERAGGI